MTNFHVELITTTQTLPLRKRVLKPFLSEAECVNPGDDLPTTFQFGLVHNNQIVSIATFIQEPFAELPAAFPYRLRGMASDKRYQGQGFGREVLLYGLESLRQTNCDLVWCNAREIAFPFYEKLGFSYLGPLFDIKDIGPHKVMYKRLIPR